MTHLRQSFLVLLPLALAFVALAAPRGPLFDIRDFGAKGDGRTIDSPAINAAIDAAVTAGGGRVIIPAGRFRSASIRLQSNVTLELTEGAVLLAADSAVASYDISPANPWSDVPFKTWGHGYQDFGHSHWRNSLIWGENIENAAIVGRGRIDGDGHLLHVATTQTPQGHANKAIGLVNCRNIVLRDFTATQCGHFALLATGVDQLLIDGLRVDTGRDGLDIDSCREVRIINTTVNTSVDDAIVLKSSFALGTPRVCENVTITNCHVSGFDPGSYLDGTYTRKLDRANGATGRIKLGTESTGGFRNIAINNVTFDYCRGLALETVDGAILEDIAISNITMRDVTNAPIFLRLGRRMRAPEGTAVGRLRRVIIANVTASGVSPEHGILIIGLPGRAIEDVTLSNITIEYRGGGTRADAAREVAEDEERYPEPYRFGRIPSYGLFARHVRGLNVEHLKFQTVAPDERPPLVLQDVAGFALIGLRAPTTEGTPVAVLRDVSDLHFRNVNALPDRAIAGPIARGSF